MGRVSGARQSAGGDLRGALRAFRAIIGEAAVFADADDRSAYSDHFAQDEKRHEPAAAVAPATVEQVREVVRAANRHKVPLWTVSRGKNFGYGGAAPVVAGSVVLDLSRMRKIEVDADNGTVLVEPGVSFYDLYDHLRERGLPLWLSVPGNSWGSVAGNALDRGVGYTPYGDHAARICGLEAVLPDGDLVRTGMGAMAGAPTWQLYKHGFGPSWDTMFCQSNFGVVTKLGLWLMPAPEAMLGFDMEFDKPEDLGWIVDTMAPLRREGIVQHSPSIGNWMRTVAVRSTRAEWSDKPSALDDAAIAAIRRKFGLGWWNLQLRLHGRLDMAEAAARQVEKAFNGRAVLSLKRTRWVLGDPPEPTSWAGVPTTVPLANSNWHGGRGGHVSFAPVLPMKGSLALEQYRTAKARYDAFGMDHQAMFSLGERSMVSINQIFYDKDDDRMMQRVEGLLGALFADGRKLGYGEYRTHIAEMDHVAGAFDFNDHALRRLNERVKDALDPNGILSPGKSGIWPARLRKPA